MKSPEAFKTISEVAKELDLPQHVLRFWETRFRQIKPLKRGGGRRYYRPDDVQLLKGIRHLLYAEGYTIKGVQRILKEQGNRFVMAAATGAPMPAATVAAPEIDANGGAAVQKQAVPVAQVASAVAASNAQSGDSRAQLQGVLTELLECKRLLDQVR
ncbi:MAG: MerR family transcriptional regulator [Rhizobiaceae bacterium]|nr:MerR family transcriptional regulator [Rhizobiaceae bacterium]